MESLVRFAAAVVGVIFVGGCATSSQLRPSPPPVEPPGLVVAVSDLHPAFVNVAAEIAKRWDGPLAIVRITGDRAVDQLSRTRVQASAHEFVAAVGLAAARWAQPLDGKRVIFSQVFNYRDAQLVSPRMKGVSAIPNLDEQFSAWKRLDPSLLRVGVVTGRGLDDVVADARRAARTHGIALDHFSAASDVEMLRHVQRHPQLQAWWILPDNRVLSRASVRALWDDARTDKQLFMVNAAGTSGALLTAYADPGDIATLVIARIRAAAASGNGTVPGPEVVPLRRARVIVNAAVAADFGLATGPRARAH